MERNERPIGPREGTEDRVEGGVQEFKGKARELAGKVTGNEETEARGKVEQLGGKARKTWGNVKDTVDEAAEKLERKGRDAT